MKWIQMVKTGRWQLDITECQQHLAMHQLYERTLSAHELLDTLVPVRETRSNRKCAKCSSFLQNLSNYTIYDDYKG